MKDCGINKIDEERIQVIEIARQVVQQSLGASEEEIEKAKNKIIGFRMKLAYNRGTEALEGNFGWTSVFEELMDQLNSIR